MTTWMPTRVLAIVLGFATLAFVAFLASRPSLAATPLRPIECRCLASATVQNQCTCSIQVTNLIMSNAECTPTCQQVEGNQCAAAASFQLGSPCSISDSLQAYAPCSGDSTAQKRCPNDNTKAVKLTVSCGNCDEP